MVSFPLSGVAKQHAESASLLEEPEALHAKCF
jgi:hypothetical protein